VLPSELPAIYFAEPSNVQLSRHRSILVLVRDVVRLINSAAKSARRYGLFYRSDMPTKVIRKRQTHCSSSSAQTQKKLRNTGRVKVALVYS